jgi:hypothetical protein
MGSTPSKLRGRITYETSYLPFLERGEAVSGPSGVRAKDEMEISDEKSEHDEEEDSNEGVGSSRMVKGRMLFGQPTQPEKVSPRLIPPQTFLLVNIA